MFQILLEFPSDFANQIIVRQVHVNGMIPHIRKELIGSVELIEQTVPTKRASDCMNALQTHVGRTHVPIGRVLNVHVNRAIRFVCILNHIQEVGLSLGTHDTPGTTGGIADGPVGCGCIHPMQVGSRTNPIQPLCPIQPLKLPFVGVLLGLLSFFEVPTNFLCHSCSPFVLCYNFLAQSGFRSYQFGIRYARPLRMSLNW